MLRARLSLVVQSVIKRYKTGSKKDTTTSSSSDKLLNSTRSAALGTKNESLNIDIKSSPKSDSNHVLQAPNRAITWSSQQQEREQAMSGPRCIGVDKSAQPSPLAAITLLAEQPVEEITARVVACDGGGALGHPRIYINLDDTSASHACGYCGKRFIQVTH